MHYLYILWSPFLFVCTASKLIVQPVGLCGDVPVNFFVFLFFFPFDSDGPKSFGRPRTTPQVRRALDNYRSRPRRTSLDPRSQHCWSTRYYIFIRLDNMAGKIRPAAAARFSVKV